MCIMQRIIVYTTVYAAIYRVYKETSYGVQIVLHLGVTDTCVGVV